MRVLITGIAGFAGSHLAEYALACGAEVWGATRSLRAAQNLAHIQSQLRLVECDLGQAEAVAALLEAAQPQWIFHLAAQTSVPSSQKAPAETFTANVLPQIHLLEAVRRQLPSARLHIAGSSEEYGRVLEGELPVRETNPLRPLSPYAVSKVAQDLLGYQYAQSYGLHIVRSRAFNHEGPRRSPDFALSSFARQLAQIERGQQEPVLRVGNLEAQRDYLDVRDVVRAYWLALEKGMPGAVYNIASGQMHAIAELLQRLIGLSRVRPEIQRDPERLRPSDVQVMCGDASLLRAQTGWEPQIPLERTIGDLLDYWRSKD